jgi:uncharacterized protein
LSTFQARYGPWAVVAGASEGIGAAFATELAMRGLNVALVARRHQPLADLSTRLASAHGVRTLPISLDLADPDAPGAIDAQLAGCEVGLLVYNAALSVIGPFLDYPLTDHLRELDVNARAPLSLTYHYGQQMVHRRRGGIILMASLAGLQGAPYIANYAATKAYNLTLAEGLWAEFSQFGVDVLACVAGATATEAYTSSIATPPSHFAPPVMTPTEVAREALDALGKRPSHITGLANRVASQILRRVLPRITTIRLMERNTKRLSRSPTS